MIKKHLIACSGILLIMIFTKLWIGKSQKNRVNSFPQKVDFPSEEKEDETSSNNSLPALEFANEGLPLSDARVAWRIHKHLKAHSYRNLQTNRLHQKAAKWFPVIEPILKLHGIPEDFKYIPLVESGFSEGTSPKGASGFWQFMPGTARTYGLEVNSEVDERKNIRKSTVAACKYLKGLFREFKSWTLVAAAYNTGENSLWREMRRQNQKNYYKMKLNRETATYLYKLVSVKQIIENPLKYGYVTRSRHMLARKEDPNPSQVNLINPRVEQDAMQALSFLNN